MGNQLAPLIVKLGGSVITDKEKPLTPDLETIDRLAVEVSRTGLRRMVLLHGGGSFGHHVASQYAILDGHKHPSQLIGLAKTRQAMMALNKLVVDALLNHDVPAISIQPSACLLTRRGRILRFMLSPVERLLNLHLIPVMYGDAVLDTELGFTILSGDQLTSRLAIDLGASKVVVGVDVDGLYTKDPKVSQDASLIEEMSLQELRSLVNILGRAKTTDVTGGMLGKVRELIPAIERGIKVRVVNAKKAEVLYKALINEEVRGTILHK